MTVRPEAHADWEAIREVHRQAFGRAGEADLVDALRGTGAFVPELSLVADAEGEVVGHLLLTRAGLRRADGAPGEVLALGPIGVLPSRQRRGVGSLLVRAGLEQAAARGFRGVVLIGHPEYYPRFGFRPAAEYGLTCRWFPVPAPVFMALPLVPGGLEGAAGEVVYPDVFDGV